jgi:hypothetical protein
VSDSAEVYVLIIANFFFGTCTIHSRDLAECLISQTADSLGRTLDNLGKDIRTVASGVAGVGESAEVYAIG